jgi:hypothetical protein
MVHPEFAANRQPIIVQRLIQLLSSAHHERSRSHHERSRSHHDVTPYLPISTLIPSARYTGSVWGRGTAPRYTSHCVVAHDIELGQC